MTIEDNVAGVAQPPALPVRPDLVRMRRERQAKLQAQLEAQDLDGLLLVTTNAVAYATGALTPGADSGRAALMGPAAIVGRGVHAPHLFTPFPDGAPPELASDHLHAAVGVEDGIEELAAALAEIVGSGTRIGVDDQSPAMVTGLTGFEFVSASGVLGAAKICKTPDELACIREAQRINELAMADVQPLLRPGIRQTDLSAAFVRRVFELGATSNAIDPIWQAMPNSLAEGPWTVHGDIAFPTPTTDRFLRDGEVVWVDTGISYEGYASDFGRTWIVATDPRPTTRQQDQYRRWRAVVDAVLSLCRPGVTGAELGRAAIEANGGVRPWIEHFYLIHGVGTDSAEMPLIGTDLGEAFDESLVLAPGMVLVLEPVIWDDGHGGYRAEDIVAVTDEGWIPLSDYPYTPYEQAT